MGWWVQDENEEMGREMAEGKLHQLERSAALAQEALEEMRKAYTVMEDHANLLDQVCVFATAQAAIRIGQLRSASAIGTQHVGVTYGV